MRLDKLIEEKLETTRKEMKRLFALKQVMIDGTVEFRQNRNVDSLLHRIEVAGEHLETNESYYLLNKPKKVVLLYLYPVFPLDRAAENDRHLQSDRLPSSFLDLTQQSQLF